jgi:hypothetical protein
MSRTLGPVGYRLVLFVACMTGACHPNTPTTVQRTDPGSSTTRSVRPSEADPAVTSDVQTAAPLDLLSGPYGYIVQHNVYFVIFAPKEGLDPHALEYAIMKYLSSGAPTVRSAWHSDDESAVPFRVCAIAM